ncbi:hypothetical protein D187_009774 [Cystobacter fuscus DSM 2262]|uniref:Uncharacterized protein n=1 Tax=Cystobacter fuscus (strain ATCC 25194 / DSM 2262 / NBRC 100088 / M29) TaxID=1242864 RepID=S9NZ54_CYSF2|nr:hypothetical protein D187_009774 [Cystobacter fuscus DSM 2262]
MVPTGKRRMVPLMLGRIVAFRESRKPLVIPPTSFPWNIQTSVQNHCTNV